MSPVIKQQIPLALELKMFLHNKQSLIAKDLHRFRVIRCGRRFGKTALMAEEIKGVAISKPSRIAYIANNYQQARDIMWDLLKKELAGAIIDTNEARLEIKTRTIKGGESLIVLRGWESIENLRGQAFDFLCLDEVAMMKGFWTNWREVLRPTLTDRKGQALFASTPKGFNHFYDLCNQELTDEEFKSFHFSSWDNPHLPQEELEKAKASLPDDIFAQEYEASFQKTQGLVYKEFNRSIHLYENLPKGAYQSLGGVDFGYRNPAATLHGKWTGEELFIDNEWYKRERNDAQIAEYVANCKFDSVYPDPENQGAIDELNRKNVNVREVIKGPGSVKQGINMIREMLKNGKLHINKRCVNLISEFEMYSYDDDKGDRNEQENPIKAYDHALDALRYIVLSLPGITPSHVIEKQNYMFNKNKAQMAKNSTK